VFLTRAREAESALGAARSQAAELRAALDEHRGPWFEAVAAGVEERVRAAMARADALEGEMAAKAEAAAAAEQVGACERGAGCEPGPWLASGRHTLGAALLRSPTVSCLKTAGPLPPWH
jgi:hypothetical protein